MATGGRAGETPDTAGPHRFLYLVESNRVELVRSGDRLKASGSDETAPTCFCKSAARWFDPSHSPLMRVISCSRVTPHPHPIGQALPTDCEHQRRRGYQALWRDHYKDADCEAYASVHLSHLCLPFFKFVVRASVEADPHQYHPRPQATHLPKHPSTDQLFSLSSE